MFNALERAQILSDDNSIRLEDLPREIVAPAAEANHNAPENVAALGDVDQLTEVQRTHVLEILQRERGNKARAAHALGINRRSLYRMLEKFETQVAGQPESAGSAGTVHTDR